MTGKQFSNRYKVRAESMLIESNPNMEDMPAGSTHWKVKLMITNGNRRSMTVPFSMGPAHTGEPGAESVLECLLSDASSAGESFEEWCGNYGWDSDSRKAERIYRAVQSQTAKLRQFLGGLYDAALMLDW